MPQSLTPKKLAPRGLSKQAVGKSHNGEGRQKSIIQIRLAERQAMIGIADMLIDRALEGDLRATEILLDRALGKAVQHVETTSESTVKHEYALSDSTRLMLEAMKEAAHQVNRNAKVIGDPVIIDHSPDTV